MKKGTSKKKLSTPKIKAPKAVKSAGKALGPLKYIVWPLRPFGRYFKGAWQELRLVTWPNRKTSLQLTAAVIVFTLILSAFIAALDFGFEELVKRIIL